MVTYPRTDARVLSTAVAKEISKNLNGISKGFRDDEVQGYIKKMIDEKYPTNQLAKTKYVNDSKITDHYAIIPTGQGYENYDKLPELQKQVYKIIVKRFLAIFYPAAEYNKIQVTVQVENELFYASGKVCVKQGFLEILKPIDKNISPTLYEIKKDSVRVFYYIDKYDKSINITYITENKQKNKTEQKDKKTAVKREKRMLKNPDIHKEPI